MSKVDLAEITSELTPVNTRYRKIKTTIPAPGTEEKLRQLEEYESRSMQGQIPLIWDSAKESSIFDAAGNQWIDFTSTIFVANIGHANEEVIAAVKRTLDKPLMHCYAYPHQQRIDYCKKLIEFVGKPFEKAFLLSAGTESTEAALKLMRLHGLAQQKKKPGIIAISGNWHGRTMGAQLMSDNPKQRKWIGFDDPNIYHIAFPYPWCCTEDEGEHFLNKELARLEQDGVDLAHDICGVMLETFQGWGACFYPTSFVQAFRRFCDKIGALLTFDEMQSGFGRTGKRFGYEHYGVEADLLCLGKGMASGFPLSGVVGRKAVMDLPEVGDMSSTHSANPVCCAAGEATLDYMLSHDVVTQAQIKGETLHQYLAKIKEMFPDIIAFTLGKGMIASILFNKENPNIDAAKFASKVVYRCWHKGLLLVHTGRESIKIGPPLTIPDEALLEGLEVLATTIKECAESEL